MTKASLMKGGKKRSMRWKVDMDCVRVTFLSAKTAAQKLWNPHWLSHSWPVWYTAYSRCRLHSVTMGFLYKLLPCYGLCDCPSPRSIYLNGIKHFFVKNPRKKNYMLYVIEYQKIHWIIIHLIRWKILFYRLTCILEKSWLCDTIILML